VRFNLRSYAYDASFHLAPLNVNGSPVRNPGHSPFPIKCSILSRSRTPPSDMLFTIIINDVPRLLRIPLCCVGVITCAFQVILPAHLFPSPLSLSSSSTSTSLPPKRLPASTSTLTMRREAEYLYTSVSHEDFV